MSREMQKRMSIIIGSFLVIVMGATAILPAISTPTQTQTIETTPLPSPEPFPQPIMYTDLDFSARYLHPSALYTVPIPQPLGWNQILPSSEAGLSRVTMRSELHVIEVYIQNAQGLTAEDLVEQFSNTILERTWRNYQNIERRGPGELRDDRFYVDYNLTLNRRNFNARHLAWTDGDRLYVVRVVGPSNATELTIFLTEQMAAEIHAIPNFQMGDAGWSGHYDALAGYAIRFPADWELQDSAAGQPTSIAIDQGTSLRLASLPVVVDSEGEGHRLLAAEITNANILSSIDWEGGYLVSFTHETALGAERSGLWRILPLSESTLIAEIDLAENELDMIALTADSAPDDEGTEIEIYHHMLEVLRTLQSVSWDYITQDQITSDEDGQIVLPIGD